MSSFVLECTFASSYIIRILPRYSLKNETCTTTTTEIDCYYCWSIPPEFALVAAALQAAQLTTTTESAQVRAYSSKACYLSLSSHDDDDVAPRRRRCRRDSNQSQWH